MSLHARRPLAFTLLVAAMPIVAPAIAAQVSLPAIFGQHMVLQQNARVPIWGRARPDEEIRVRAGWMAADAVAKADKNGCWRVDVATPAAGGPHRVTIAGAANEIVLDDVMLGEVWLGSGQSNMEMRLRELRKDRAGAIDWEAELKGDALPPIRLFDVANTIAATPQSDCKGEWSTCRPERVREFSAVAWFFGRELWRELKVPIGLVTADWGGTPAESWTSAAALRGFPRLTDGLARVARIEDPEVRRKLDDAARDWWRQLDGADPGSKAGWQAGDADAADWKTMPVPGRWRGDLDGFDGVVWFRHQVTIPDAWAGQALTLELGPIDDMDDAWVNGERVGGEHDPQRWNRARRYAVPASAVRAGRCAIAIRVVDTGGDGGLVGRAEQYRLRPTADRNAQPLALAGDWRWRAGVPLGELAPLPPSTRLDAGTPSVLGNGMIAPLAPFRFAGVIWYQGESNRGHAIEYRSLLPALIADWRQRFAQPELPFHLVQIAPYAYGNDRGEAALLREAQLLTLSVPRTGLAVTMDLGDPKDIHPHRKEEVGRRLARWALARDYGRADVVCAGPVCHTQAFTGRTVRLTFADAAGLKTRDGKPPVCFTIAGADRKFVAATATIDGEQVVVEAQGVDKPVAVRFAWGAADEPNLCNGAGLPASSFRTDDW